MKIGSKANERRPKANDHERANLICNQLVSLQTDLAALVIAAERTADIDVSELPEAEKSKHALLKEMIDTRRATAAEELASHVAKHHCAN